MNLLENYFDNEIREGFFVPSMVKRAWAAELRVLAEIDRICSKYNIKYFAEWGTLLGAIRHAGFIPWDDDLDIGMLREDYNKFLEVAPKELPDGYRINNLHTKGDFWLFLARVINSSHMDFSDEHLIEFNEFPYIAGVDIFLIDYVSKDEEAEKQRDVLSDYIIHLADHIAEKKMTSDEIRDGFFRIKSICGKSFENQNIVSEWINSAEEYTVKDNSSDLCKSIVALHTEMYAYAEELFGQFSEDEASELTQLFPFGMRDPKFRYPKEYYRDFIRVPFENTTIPVPLGYDAMLRRRYGDYMTIKKGRSAHDYPFYEGQQAELDKLMDVRMPRYTFDDNEKTYAAPREKLLDKDYAPNSFKKYVVETYNSLCYESDLAKAQSLAINLGNTIEDFKCSGGTAVEILEEYCELLYQLSQADNESDVETIQNRIQYALGKLGVVLEDTLLNRKEVLFVVDKYSEWKWIKEYVIKESMEPDYDVTVVAAPYFGKRFDGSLNGINDEKALFDQIEIENVTFKSYDSYQLAFHHPEKIYIQNPYDQWDSGISIHPYYYTENLKKNCDELIYVPPFKLDEFDDTYYCEYHNMTSYVTVPGVVRADKVYVQSENMRGMYIKKLTDWASKDTENIWHQKISVCDSSMLDDEEVAQGKALVLDADSMKNVLYHTEISIIIQYGEKALDKIETVLGIFKSNSDKVHMIWNINEEFIPTLKRLVPEYLDRFNRLVSLAKDIGTFEISDGKNIADNCTAYYGDSCYLVRRCQLRKIPIMIGNAE